MQRRACSVILRALLLVSGCNEHDVAEDAEASSVVLSAPSALPKSLDAGVPKPRYTSDAVLCQQKITAVKAEPTVEGAPELERQREVLLARAKGRPVLFLRAPAHALGPNKENDAYRERFNSPKSSTHFFYQNYSKLVRNPELARFVLLREGYLYAERPGLAAALANVVRLEDLFREKTIWLSRGGEIMQAARHREGGETLYRFVDGSEKGRRAGILFLDRVSADPSELAEPLHRDFSPLQAELGFDRARIVHLTPTSIVAELRYGDVWVSSLLESEGARVKLGCEAASDAELEIVGRARQRHRARLGVLGALREAIAVQVEESLPFDEPKTEYGQEDGKLRQAWAWAYRQGETRFEYNEDRYQVFDLSGRPKVPQVCIDFITDTLERASGTWYRAKDEPRERVRGRLDFDAFEIENRRSVENFVKFTESRPEWFEVWQLPRAEQIPFRRRHDFFEYIKQHRDAFVPGDIVTILGLRDDEKEHYHSFFVYDADPISGMPIWLASNAGRPRIRVWENELNNAPRRSIRTRIRPNLDWLYSVIGPAVEEPERTAGAPNLPVPRP